MNPTLDGAPEDESQPIPAQAPGEVLIEQAEFKLWLTLGEEPTLSASGRLREAEPGAWLVPALERAATLIGDSEQKAAVLDVSRLEYTNAPCFRAMVGWIGGLQQRTPPVAMRVMLDPTQLWQRVALHTLRVAGAETVDVTGGAELPVEEG